MYWQLLLPILDVVAISSCGRRHSASASSSARTAPMSQAVHGRARAWCLPPVRVRLRQFSSLSLLQQVKICLAVLLLVPSVTHFLMSSALIICDDNNIFVTLPCSKAHLRTAVGTGTDKHSGTVPYYVWCCHGMLLPCVGVFTLMTK